MKKNIRRNVWGICFIILMGFICNFFIFGNVKMMFTIAEGLDESSYFYKITMKQIYKQSSKKKVRESITDDLELNENIHLHNMYIKVLGINGEEAFTGILIKKYAQYQHNKNYRSTVNRIVDAIGLTNNYDMVPFLETLLNDYEKLNVQVTKYSILRSLYLLTGNQYSYRDDSGRQAKFQISEEIRTARELIEISRNRKRTIEEMLYLDKLYGPPE